MRKGTERLCLDHYLEVLNYKPGALAGATALSAARACGSFTAVHERFWTAARRKLGDAAGTRALIEVLLAHRHLDHRLLVGEWTGPSLPARSTPQVVLVEARRSSEGGRTGSPSHWVLGTSSTAPARALSL